MPITTRAAARQGRTYGSGSDSDSVTEGVFQTPRRGSLQQPHTAPRSLPAPRLVNPKAKDGKLRYLSRELALCVLGFIVVFLLLSHGVASSRSAFEDCCDSPKLCDARATALTVLNETSPKGPVENIRSSVMRADAWKRREPKGTGVVLYCMASPSDCSGFLQKLEKRLQCGGLPTKCVTTIKARGRESENLAGETQSEMLSVLKDCSRAVILFEGFDRMTVSEAKVLNVALSEHGSFLLNGTSFTSTEALFLLTVNGQKEAETLGEHRLLQQIRQEVADAIVAQNSDANGVDEIARAIRRRIDHVFPILPSSLKTT